MYLGDAHYRHCGDMPETTLHVLRDFPMAMMAWVALWMKTFDINFFYASGYGRMVTIKFESS